VESVRITPEPSEEERRAILAALAEDETGSAAPSAWADVFLDQERSDQNPGQRPEAKRIREAGA
jgi:hypothetical protein